MTDGSLVFGQAVPSWGENYKLYRLLFPGASSWRPGVRLLASSLYFSAHIGKDLPSFDLEYRVLIYEAIYLSAQLDLGLLE